jgi:hypothetical protein
VVVQESGTQYNRISGGLWTRRPRTRVSPGRFLLKQYPADHELCIEATIDALLATNLVSVHQKTPCCGVGLRRQWLVVAVTRSGRVSGRAAASCSRSGTWARCPGDSQGCREEELWDRDPFGIFRLDLLAPNPGCMARLQRLAATCSNMQQFLRLSRGREGGWLNRVEPSSPAMRRRGSTIWGCLLDVCYKDVLLPSQLA